mgnify:CR=1 FL=1
MRTKKPPNILVKVYLVMRSVESLIVFIFDRLRFYDAGRVLLLKTRLGPAFNIRAGSSDMAEVAAIFSNSEYPKCIFPRKKGCTIVDLGASIGSFSIYIASILDKYNPRIYAIEPSSENYNLLLENITKNKMLSVISPVQAAVSDHNGKALLNIMGPKDTFRISSGKENNNCEVCKSYSFRSLCKAIKVEKIDLLKIDIEGAEFEVIHDSIHILRDNVSSILIEIHESYSNKRTLRLIRTLLNNHFRLIDVNGGHKTYYFRK